VTLVLHDFELDEGSYKVRLLPAFLGLPFERVPVDVFPGREQDTPAFRALSPRGTLPVLVNGGLVLRDAEAILAYLARRYDERDQWLPADDPALFGEVMTWLSFAAGPLRAATLARLHAMLEVPADMAAAIRGARGAFRDMEDHMTARGFDGAEWFVGGTPTIADVALYPALALSRDAGIEHDAYPALRRWLRRFRGLPGFRTMPGIPDYY